MSHTTIYHNPKCSTSRNTLALLRERGLEPDVIEYLKTPPDHATLTRLVADSGQSAADFLRSKEALYTELGLDAPGVADAQRLAAAIAHPQLLQRPIVVTPRGVRVCRPVERVLEIL